ncbi:MAG: hypothetical protein IH897_09735, partial [Planctomycetes bacterium]|nr:hypothetical protein [Planctomycetota bacterium]
MVKEPTKPPEDTLKPEPPDYDLLTQEGRDGLFADGLEGLPDPLTPEGRDKLFEAKGPSVTMSTAAFAGHTSDPEFSPPDRKAGPDDEVVFSEAETCDEHEGCMKVTTERMSPPRSPTTGLRLDGLPESAIGRGPLTNDPGYEAGSLTNDESPDRVPVTQTITPEFSPLGERPADAAGPFWDDVPPADDATG